MQEVTIKVDEEIKALGDLIKKEVEDIKAKKGVAVYISDAMPALLTLASGYQKLPVEIKTEDNIAYLAKCVAGVFVPAPVAAPAA